MSTMSAIALSLFCVPSVLLPVFFDVFVHKNSKACTVHCSLLFFLLHIKHVKTSKIQKKKFVSVVLNLNGINRKKL